MALAAAAAAAASAMVCVVALAFGLYALLVPSLGRPGAAAIVAASAALLIALIAMILGRRPKRKPAKKASGGTAKALDRALDLLGDKPLAAAVAALAAGFLAIRNPGYLGAVVRAFVDGQEKTKR